VQNLHVSTGVFLIDKTFFGIFLDLYHELSADMFMRLNCWVFSLELPMPDSLSN
jgi:hypothetical protein